MTEQEPKCENKNDFTGRTIQGRYRISRMIGQGAQSSVFQAEDILLSREAVIKIYHQASPQFAERFKRETQVLGSLDHPNIVKVFSSGITEDGRYYFGMEYLQGKTLEQILAEQKLTAAEFLHIFKEITKALDYLHEHSVLHRDLKPANIMVVPQNGQVEAALVKIVDFGIAKIFESENQVSKTQTMNVGTASYMSPELCLDKGADARSDVYSLSCIMWQALFGKPPFEGESDYDIMYKQANSALPEVVTNQQLYKFICKGLEKDPGNRWQNAKEMLNNFPTIDAIERHLGSTTAPRARKYPVSLISILIGLFVLAGICAGYFYTQGRNDQNQTILKQMNAAGSASSLGPPKRVMQKLNESIQKSDPLLAKRILESTEDDIAHAAELRQGAYNALSMIQFQSGKYQDALDTMNDAVEELDLNKLTNPKLKREALYRRAIRENALSPSDPRARADAEDALALCLASDRDKPSLSAYYTFLSQWYGANKQMDKADDYVKKALNIFPHDPEGKEYYIVDAEYQLVNILLNKGTPAATKEALQRMNHIKNLSLTATGLNRGALLPSLPAKLITFASLCSAKGALKTEEILALLEQAELVNIDDLDDARKAEIARTRAQGLELKAVILFKMGQRDKAIAAVAKGISLIQDQQSAFPVDTLVHLGQKAMFLGDEKLAVHAWEMALEKQQFQHDTIAGAQDIPPGILLGDYYLQKDPRAAADGYGKACKFLQANYPKKTKLIERASAGLTKAQEAIVAAGEK